MNLLRCHRRSKQATCLAEREDDAAVVRAPAPSVRGCATAHGLCARLAEDELAGERPSLKERHPELGRGVWHCLTEHILRHGSDLVHDSFPAGEGTQPLDLSTRSCIDP